MGTRGDVKLGTARKSPGSPEAGSFEMSSLLKPSGNDSVAVTLPRAFFAARLLYVLVPPVHNSSPLVLDSRTARANFLNISKKQTLLH